MKTTRSSDDRKLSRRDTNSQLAFLSFVMALLSAVVNIVSNVNNNNNNNNNNDNNNNNNQNNRNQNMGTVQSQYVLNDKFALLINQNLHLGFGCAPRITRCKIPTLLVLES